MWSDREFSSFKEGSILNGKRVNFPFRVLTEEEYQHAKRCVNENLKQHSHFAVKAPWLPNGSVEVHFLTFDNQTLIGRIYNEDRQEEEVRANYV